MDWPLLRELPNLDRSTAAADRKQIRPGRGDLPLYAVDIVRLSIAKCSILDAFKTPTQDLLVVKQAKAVYDTVSLVLRGLCLDL